MSNLYDIAQRHLDAYGVRAAALAKRMGTSPQTLDSWKNRGLKTLPSRRLLEALARETGTPYGDVLTAVLRDIDYLPRGSEHGGHPAAIAAQPTIARTTSPAEEEPGSEASPQPAQQDGQQDPPG
jgi:transcriptional regulator with XRE-family HTH domain